MYIRKVLSVFLHVVSPSYHLVSANHCVFCAGVRCEDELATREKQRRTELAAEYLVVVQVVGKTSDEELVRGIGNHGGDDACTDDKEQSKQRCRNSAAMHRGHVATRGHPPGTWNAGCSEIPGSGR